MSPLAILSWCSFPLVKPDLPLSHNEWVVTFGSWISHEDTLQVQEWQAALRGASSSGSCHFVILRRGSLHGTQLGLPQWTPPNWSLVPRTWETLLAPTFQQISLGKDPHAELKIFCPALEAFSSVCYQLWLAGTSNCLWLLHGFFLWPLGCVVVGWGAQQGLSLQAPT